jgi:voltage-gated potassium channel
MAESLRSRVYESLESTSIGNRLGRWIDGSLIALILANVAAITLETVDPLVEQHAHFFRLFEVFSVAVFTVEYAARVWTSVESPRPAFQHPVGGRLRFMATPLALIDLVAILPFYLSAFFAVDLRLMRVLRLLRLLKLTRYSPAIETLAVVVYDQRRALAGVMMLLLIVVVLGSSAAYHFEHEAQPQSFASIPHAIYWGMVTMGTVGYGDIVPVTLGGRVVAVGLLMAGASVFALITGILATGFAEELQKRQFVVSWQLVASVPLFQGLDAMRIAKITRLLLPKVVPPRYAIVIRGEMGDSMYFIAEGEAEVETPTAVYRLAAGDFFGEIALLKHCPRTASVTAVTECRLLLLPADHFQRFLYDNPEIKDALADVIERRLAALEGREIEASASPPPAPVRRAAAQS